MRKVSTMFLLFVSAVIFSGCTKTYKTVEDYDTAMKTVRSKIPAYTIEAKHELQGASLYYKSYVKGNKWKTEMSLNGGNSYLSTILYDGTDLLSYTLGSPYAMKNPAIDVMGKEMDEESLRSVIDMQNPTSALFTWHDGYPIMAALPADAEPKAEFENQKANVNGFDCRMIKFGTDREACVSDKYGIAVYHKLKLQEPKAGQDEISINLVKVDTSDIPDATFELPDGVKKADMNTMLQEMSNNLENMSRKFNTNY